MSLKRVSRDIIYCNRPWFLESPLDSTGNSLRTWDLHCNFQTRAVLSLDNRFATTSCLCSDKIAWETKKNWLCTITDISKNIFLLTYWPLGDLNEIQVSNFQPKFDNQCWVMSCKMALRWMSLVIIWANVDLDLCRHAASIECTKMATIVLIQWLSILEEKLV